MKSKRDTVRYHNSGGFDASKYDTYGEEIKNKTIAQRISELPHGRQAQTVLVLRQLVKDMWETGLNASDIARKIGMNHTTILYHLWKLGIDPWARVEEQADSSRQFKQILLAKRIERKEIKVAEQKEAEKKLAEARIRRDKRIKEEREAVFRLYKKGAKYVDIACLLGIKHSRVQDLLLYHPKYRAEMRPPHVNKGRAIWKVSLGGKRIQRYNTVTEAANSVGAFRNTITMAAKGRIPTAKGYRWEYDT